MSQLRVHPTVGLYLAARSAANCLTAVRAVWLVGFLQIAKGENVSPKVYYAHTWPILPQTGNSKTQHRVLDRCESRGVSALNCEAQNSFVENSMKNVPLLAARPKVSQFAAFNPLAGVAPHRVLRVLSA